MHERLGEMSFGEFSACGSFRVPGGSSPPPRGTSKSGRRKRIRNRSLGGRMHSQLGSRGKRRWKSRQRGPQHLWCRDGWGWWEQQGEAGLGFDNREHQSGFGVFTIVSDLNHENGFLVITTVPLLLYIRLDRGGPMCYFAWNTFFASGDRLGKHPEF